MAYPVTPVVNTLLERAKEKKIQGMTQMKVQKLMYYAQAWYLKLNDGKPLIDEYFSRWKYGPVIPSLYHSLKKYGSNNVDLIANVEKNGDDVKIVYPLIDNALIHAFLDKILEVYGSYSANELSAITHKKGSAWEKGGKGGDESVISHDEMIEEIG